MSSAAVSVSAAIVVVYLAAASLAVASPLAYLTVVSKISVAPISQIWVISRALDDVDATCSKLVFLSWRTSWGLNPYMWDPSELPRGTQFRHVILVDTGYVTTKTQELLDAMKRYNDVVMQVCFDAR